MDTNRIQNARQNALRLLKKSGTVISEDEENRLEYCDYSLGNFDVIGTEILTYVNTSRICAKEIILMPGQICPEHLHPPLDDYPGKEEIFRCRWGEIYLYVPGIPAVEPHGTVPPERKKGFTVWHEILLKPGDQYHLKENTLHWFQAGPEGAIISEFSTPSFDDKDIFTDSDIHSVSVISSE